MRNLTIGGFRVDPIQEIVILEISLKNDSEDDLRMREWVENGDMIPILFNSGLYESLELCLLRKDIGYSTYKISMTFIGEENW